MVRETHFGELNYDFMFFDASKRGVRTYFYTNNKPAWIGKQRMLQVQADRQCYIFKEDKIRHLLQKAGAASIDQTRDACLQTKNFTLAVSINGATAAQYFVEKAAYKQSSLSRKHSMTPASVTLRKNTDPEESHRDKRSRRD